MQRNAGLTRPTPEDGRGWLWFVTILSAIYSVCFLGARLFGKYGSLWYDDIVLGFGYLVGGAQWGMTMDAISHGLGIDQGESWKMLAGEDRISQLVFASRILLLICLYSSKTAVALFTRRVFSGDINHQTAIFRAYFAALAVCATVTVVLGSLPCPSPSNTHGQTCYHESECWIVIFVLDIITEIIVIVVPVILIQPIQLNSTDKRRVLALFAFRVGNIALSVALLARIFTEDDKFNADSSVLVLQEVLLCYSFVSASIPRMRPFLGAFFSQGMTLLGPSQNRSVRNESIALTSLSTRKGLKTKESALRPDLASYDVNIVHGRRRHPGEGASIASDGSERMMIRRHTEIQVHGA